MVVITRPLVNLTEEPHFHQITTVIALVDTMVIRTSGAIFNLVGHMEIQIHSGSTIVIVIIGTIRLVTTILVLATAITFTDIMTIGEHGMVITL